MNGVVPVNQPLLDGNEKRYLAECIDTGWISSEGPFVTRLEREFAARVGMDSSRFSRCLRGRFEFAPHERQRIAEALDYPAEWLFLTPEPPARKTSAGLIHAHT